MDSSHWTFGETITIYAAANIANGDGSDDDDRIRTTTTSGTLMSTTAPLTAMITQSTDATCFGLNNGTATVTATDGTPPYFYNWDNGESTMIATMLGAGPHTVTVTDSGTDMTTTMVTIGQPTMLSGNVVPNPASCGLANGQATAQGSGGSPGYMYNWSDGQTGAMAVNLISGNYQVTITDVNNCMTTLNTFVPDLSANFSVNLLNQVDINCNGNNNGILEVAGANGQAPYQFSWSTGSNMSIITNLIADTYSVTVMDASGCTVTDSYIITEPAFLTLASINTQNVSCNGGNDGSLTAMAGGGTMPYMYAWPNGGTGPTNSNLVAGSYEVTVTDANGCQTVTSSDFVVTEPSAIIASSSGTGETSSGSMDGSASAMASGGTPGYNYSWVGPNGFAASTAMINNLPPGNYVCTICDMNMCCETVQYNVSAGGCELSLSAEATPVSCHSGNNGSITATPMNGSGNYIWLWSNGGASETISNLTAGTYSVTCTDDLSCTFTLQVEVTQPDTLIGVAEIIMAPSCSNSADGIITINTTGGTGAYTNNWLSGVVADTLFNVTAGSNGAIVLDENMCGITVNFMVDAMDLTPPASNLVDTVFLELPLSGTTDTLRVSDFDLGSTDNCGAAVTIMHTKTDYSCMDVGLAISVPVELSDDSGNISLDTVIVIVEDNMAPSIFCIDDLTVNNCDPFTYDIPVNFDNCGVTLEQIAGPPNGSAPGPGTHVITYQATDPSGNSNSCSFNLTVDSDLMADVNVDNHVSCFGFTDACVSFTATGGAAPYTFDFTNIDLINCNALGAGKWEYQITDASGCVVTDSVTITAPDVLLIEAGTIVTNATTSNSNDGSIDITVTGGVATFQYEWFLNGTVISNDEDPMNLGPGFYTCVVTDSNGCTYNSIEWEIQATTSTKALPAFAEFLSVFPNPASDQLKVKLDRQSMSLSAVSLISISGREMYKESINSSQCDIDVSSYPSGIYLLKVTADHQSIIKKLIIQ